MITKIYYIIIRLFLKKTFLLWQKLGFHITPNHYYQPIPDTRTLKDDLWQKKSELIGININEEKQLNLLRFFYSKYKEEYSLFPKHKTAIPYQYYLDNHSFDSIDAEILYCIIRHFKPNTVLEVGSGFSTYLSAQAISKNKQENNNYQCELIAIEPYPNNILQKGFPNLSRVVPKKIQDVSLLEFEKLTENDILFIDSSHVLKIESDVYYEYLEILPRLNKGVLVHFHDIFLPLNYPKHWITKEYLFWNEQYLLQAFLVFNSGFEVVWAGNYMDLNHHNELEMSFGSYKTGEKLLGSFWIRKL